MGLRPVAGFAAAMLVVAAVAGYAIGGDSGDGGGTNTIVAGKAPGVTAKMVSEGDAGTLRLANVHQLPDDKVLEAWVQREARWKRCRPCSSPTTKAAPAPGSPTWRASKR